MTSAAISVRIVEWNVAMSVSSKAHLLADLSPTIAILPESAHPDRTRQALEAIGATAVKWIGAKPTKGLSAVAFAGWQLRIDDSYDPGYQWVMPLHLGGPREIRVLAVWDRNHRGGGHETARKLGACRASMAHYEEFLSRDADLTLISGDFNNSVFWDKPKGRTKFGDFMDQMESRGFVSAITSITDVSAERSRIQPSGGPETSTSRTTSTTRSCLARRRSKPSLWVRMQTGLRTATTVP